MCIDINWVIDMLSENCTTGNLEVEAGPASDWIERYYQEKLDRRPKRGGMEAACTLLGHMLYLN